jgi:hypothetical protein
VLFCFTPAKIYPTDITAVQNLSVITKWKPFKICGYSFVCYNISLVSQVRWGLVASIPGTFLANVMMMEPKAASHPDNEVWGVGIHHYHRYKCHRYSYSFINSKCFILCLHRLLNYAVCVFQWKWHWLASSKNTHTNNTKMFHLECIKRIKYILNTNQEHFVMFFIWLMLFLACGSYWRWLVERLGPNLI